MILACRSTNCSTRFQAPTSQLAVSSVGRWGFARPFITGRSTLTSRSRTHFETEGNADVIVVTEIPYQDTRDRIREKLEMLVRDERIAGIPHSRPNGPHVPSWQVRLHIVLKRDADKDVVLNQLF